MMGIKHDPAPLAGPPPTKICGGPCGQRLLLTDYHVNNQRPDRRHIYCKACTIAKVTQQRANAREYRRRLALIALRRDRLRNPVCQTMNRTDGRGSAGCPFIISNEKKGIVINERRLTLWQRDHKRCWYCGCPLELEEIVADHLVPKSQGGSDGLSNRVAACRSCDHHKAGKTLGEFRAARNGVRFYGEKHAPAIPPPTPATPKPQPPALVKPRVKRLWPKLMVERHG